MDLRHFVRVLQRSWQLIAAVTLVAAVVATLYTLLQKPTYEATSSVFISTNSSSVQELSQGSLFAQNIVKSYADVSTTSYVLAPVIAQLHLDTTPEQLAKSITATAPLDTTIVNLAVSDHNPRQAASIANAVSNSLISVVDELVPESGAASSVKITRVQSAVVPPRSISPNVPLNLILGVLVGLALGLGIAFIRDSLNTRVRTADDVQVITKAPILGRVPLDPAAAENPLSSKTGGRDARAESFRALRTNLQFFDFGGDVRSIVVTSSLESEGKSTSAANLAIALANAGEKVVLVEADLRRPKLPSYLQIDGAVGLTDVLIGQVPLDEALQPWGNDGLWVLPAGRVPPNPSELLASSVMASTLTSLGERFTTVLIDAPPLLAVTDAVILSKISNGAVVICAVNRTKRPQLSAALGSLEAAGARVLGVVLNMLPTKGPDSGYYGAYYYSYGQGDLEAKVAD